VNVTFEISDSLEREAERRAADEGLSLSAWVTAVIHRELARPRSATLLEAVGNEESADFDIEFPRIKGGLREVDFS
jgi:hypothetical protein